MASGLASAGAGTAAAGATGYAIGEYIVNPALNWATRKATDNEHETLGTWIYELLHKDSDDKIEQMLAPAPLPTQEVDVNAQISLNLAPDIVVQKQSMEASCGNVRMSTGNINADAP
ncbi:MAG: hypothetical protein LBU76_09100 [Azoarcus sp.]|jgi:hypothetical protein|nr:hypothetical protein [Azoarcus sp.]